jgi:hypothetical protein
LSHSSVLVLWRLTARVKILRPLKPNFTMIPTSYCLGWFLLSPSGKSVSRCMNTVGLPICVLWGLTVYKRVGTILGEITNVSFFWESQFSVLKMVLPFMLSIVLWVMVLGTYTLLFTGHYITGNVNASFWKKNT